ncbi:MAG: hypothetical protein JSV91_04080 [Phycisphaerales bacterium]|nr:MAG: hypothetical protein JSV91_04080 [Phycisphaerales bacterium]
MIEPAEQPSSSRVPGVCIPWEERLKELAENVEDEQLLKRVWQDVDSLAYTFIWHCLVSF